MNNNKKKIFLLGVGAQKAGTTWLHSQLSHNSNIDFGFRKEYHVFDAFGDQKNAKIKRRLVRHVLEKKKNKSLGINANQKCFYLKLLSFLDNTQNYFDYFDYLYLKNDAVELVGDITPSYALLESNIFEHIKSELEKRDFEVKLVFLMRDPYERIWSNYRMGKRNNSLKGINMTEEDEEGLRMSYQNSGIKRRTEYQRTVEELEKVFSPKNIHYGFYENLFTEEGYGALSSFLGIDLLKPDFDYEVNVSPKTKDISESLKSEICNCYKETYMAIDKMSDGKSKELWRGYHYLE